MRLKPVRRTDRLFEIIQIISDGRLHLARDIAETLEVSVRTVYRDIDSLVASGVPVEGERGVGYLLREPIHLPPLTLTAEELEALHFGMAVAAQATEPLLQKAAASLLAKIDRALPASRRASPQHWGFAVYPQEEAQASHPHLPALRRAVREKRKLRLLYRTPADQVAEERVVRPLQVEFWGWAWTLTAWCELRGDFRVFRADRILAAEILPDSFADEPGRNLMDYLRLMAPPATSRHSR
jgi:predicted DNA-binding transcriptional regulator YafY